MKHEVRFRPIADITKESVSNGRRKTFAGSLGRLPDGRVRIVGADDGEELFTLTGLLGLLARADGGKTRIVIQRLQIRFPERDEKPVLRPFGNQREAPLVLAVQIGRKTLFIVNAIALIGSGYSSLTITAHIVPYRRNEFADLGPFASVAADGNQCYCASGWK